MQLLKWVQSEFPTLHPGGVTDSNPLMLPAPQRPIANGKSLDLARLEEQSE
jgi:nitrous oxidase accessory protein